MSEAASAPRRLRTALAALLALAALADIAHAAKPRMLVCADQAGTLTVRKKRCAAGERELNLGALVTAGPPGAPGAQGPAGTPGGTGTPGLRASRGPG